MNMPRAAVAWGLVLAFAVHALADVPVVPVKAPPFPGQKPAGEVKSEKLMLRVVVKHADLKGEGDGVQAKIVLPARLREAFPPPAGAPAKVGSNEGVPRSLIAAVVLSLAAVSVVFVIRGKQLNLASKAAILGVAVLAAGYAVAEANAPPPRNFNQPKPVEAPKSQIVIEFSADVAEAILTLPEK